MNNTDISESKQRQLANLKPFPKGVSGNPLGRPVGSVSPIGRVKQIFEEHPEEFESFIRGYLKDPSNRKHIVEMIDGGPRGSGIDVNIDNRSITFIGSADQNKEIDEFVISRYKELEKEGKV